IPHHDHLEVYARYCRLMLLLFKPWCWAKDLRQSGQGWEDTCDPHFHFMMKNMQLHHECRTSRDD
ncbi:hypothetical protein F4604DRAFT_1505413, partial [Suillus subluteus]